MASAIGVRNLCFSNYYEHIIGESDRCVVCVMNQYGKTESWMEKFVVNCNGGISNAIGFSRNVGISGSSVP